MTFLIDNCMRLRRQSIHLLLVLVLLRALGQLAFAQEMSSPLNATQQLAARWNLFEEYVQSEELARASDEINQLLMIRDGAGIEALPDYASKLLEIAKKADLDGDQDRARIFFRWALKVAPQSPEILWQVFPVYHKYGLGSMFKLFQSMLGLVWSSPFRLLVIGEKSLYPLLTALSWTIYLTFIGIIAGDLINIFRVLAWYVRPSLRGIVVPILFLSIFALPTLLGFLWCLALWALAVFIFIPERRRLSLASGILILAWGVLIPVSENLSSWLRSDQVKRVILASDQPLRDEERSHLESELSMWSGDAVVQFKFAQLLRRANLIQAAERVLIALEHSIGAQYWLEAERGVLYSMKGEFSLAEKSLRQAIEAGGENTEVIFNLSKVVFELDNTKESRELFGRALRKNKQRVEFLRKREEVLGIHDPRSFADVDLPLLAYFRAALVPNHLSFPSAEAKARQLMVGCDPRVIALIGFLIIAIHLSGHQRSRRINPKGFFDEHQGTTLTSVLVHLIPGGGLFIRGKFRSGFLILFLMVVSAAPLLQRSYLEPSASLVAWFLPFHLCTWLGLYLSLALWSIQREREL